MMRKVLTIMVVPDHKSSKVRVLHLPTFFVFLALAIGILWIGFFVFFSGSYYCQAVDKSELKQMTDEKHLLCEELESLALLVDSLKSEIAFLTDQDKALRLFADLPEIDDETRMAGVGGTAFSSEEFDFDRSDPTCAPPSVGANVNQLLREAVLLKSSFEEIENRFQDQRELLDHTPTLIPTTGWFSSYYGRRHDPFTGRRQFHYGVDIANRKGTPIYAPADGVVKYYGYDKSFGRLLVIDHGYGCETRYGHLHKCSLKKGQEVKRGQCIAFMGSTGRSTSSHLHYEVKLNGKHQNPLNYFYADVVVD
jgi:hypothetical protein